MDTDQRKIQWQGEVVSVQPRSTVWRYLTDNRTHRENGYNVFFNGRALDEDHEVEFKRGKGKYDFCVAISEKQAGKIRPHIGDEIKGTGWTPKYPECEFADLYRAGSLKKVKPAEENVIVPEIIAKEDDTTYYAAQIIRVDSSSYPGPPWRIEAPSLEVYAWRGERMLSKSAWKGKCFECIWANMANVTIQYDFDKNLVRNRFETFCYGPLSCRYYKMGPARAVPYKGISGVKDQGWLDEICVEYRADSDE